MIEDIEAPEHLNDDAVLEIGPESRLLNLVLHSACSELRCYGETYKLDPNSDNQLIFSESCIPVEVNFSEEILAFANETNSEVYIDGVGLPGSCKSNSIVSLHTLNTLLRDEHFFDAGGARLSRAGTMFHSAATVPVMFTTTHSGEPKSKFLGALVLYFTEEIRYPAVLLEFLNTLSMFSSLYSKGEEYRALLTREPMIELSTRKSSASIFRFLQTAEVEQPATPIPTSEAAESSPAKPTMAKKLKKMKKKVKPWLKRYFNKWTGGAPSFLDPLRNDYCVVVWICGFSAIAVLQTMFDKINDGFAFQGEKNLFPLPGSFGALCTILFALPAAPLAQPRIVFAAHTWAMIVTTVITRIFYRHHYVWLQMALSLAFTATGMAKFGILNPPAGAISVALVQYYNSDSYSDGGLLFSFVAIYMCCTTITLIAIIVHNTLKDRSYPVCW